MVQFVRTFLAVEHEAHVAALAEPDEKKALAKIHRADGFYAGHSTAGIQRPDEIGDDERDEAKKVVARALFLVHEYGKGKLYQAIVGEPYKRPYGTAFGAALFIAKKSGELKIVARYQPCPQCDATGTIGGKSCRDCKGSGWSHKDTGDAIDFASLGKPTATKRLAAPDVDRFAAAYNA
ncbi:MAG: hypothetical protein ACXVCV_15205 [Polyangia bacterium]